MNDLVTISVPVELHKHLVVPLNRKMRGIKRRGRTRTRRQESTHPVVCASPMHTHGIGKKILVLGCGWIFPLARSATVDDRKERRESNHCGDERQSQNFQKLE